MDLLDRHVIVDGVRLALRDRGDGDPVVFVHGTPSHSVEWRDVVPHVEAAGHRVVTYDLLGYGRSERPVDRDTSVGAQTDILVGLLDVLGIERASLITHDIGGAVGQRMAVLHPERVRRLMLIDAVSYDSWPSETWRAILRTGLDDLARLPAAEFEAMLIRQLTMTVADGSVMTGDVLEAFLAPHRSAVGRASFVQHQIGTYDSARPRSSPGGWVRCRSRCASCGARRTAGSRPAGPSVSPATSRAPSSSSYRARATSSWRTTPRG
ncbi:hypothetical protein Acsp06_53770 [Actinomycetospora sp. NBRC 106375]|nr:alpha/beta fold hydrolase [Actinomycetospora sp. NBRC 106375]GLZ49192.1 hypothetical protein Acsp06_53770 [Actinomycetospora sp. NBRC 106375]